jgi:hypothetical protein
MNDREAPPKQFANNVLQQVASHMLADDIVVEPDDFMAMRVAFRSLGGTWTEVASGNIVHLELLKKVVTAWGNMPGRKHRSEETV